MTSPTRSWTALTRSSSTPCRAAKRPEPLYLIEPDVDHLAAAAPDAHSMDPVGVLQLVHSLGGKTGRLFLVGCEPALLDCEEGRFGLSAPVQAAVPGPSRSSSASSPICNLTLTRFGPL